jgi:hypothetical protein
MRSLRDASHANMSILTLPIRSQVFLIVMRDQLRILSVGNVYTLLILTLSLLLNSVWQGALHLVALVCCRVQTASAAQKNNTNASIHVRKRREPKIVHSRDELIKPVIRHETHNDLVEM